jgi:hypothetical protein
MPLLPMLTREAVDPEVRPLWDECERAFPAFRHLWAPQAHSLVVDLAFLELDVEPEVAPREPAAAVARP